MTRLASKLKSQIAELSYEDRKALYRFLGRSLQESGVDRSDEWTKELDRRSDELRNNPSLGIPAEEVFAKLRRKRA